MSELQKVKSFWDSMSYREKRCQCLDLKKGQNPFITISRETGAGGHSLAKAILAEMEKYQDDPLFKGWHLCDQEICYKIAEEPGMSLNIPELLDHEYHSEIQDMIMQIVGGLSPQDKVQKKMFEYIRSTALFGKTIFVGRGSSCLTRDLPLGIHYRLKAPLKKRIQRIMTLLKLNEKGAREKITEKDQARAGLIHNYFHKNIDDPLLYDAVWNTDAMEIEDIAKATLALVKQKSCHCGALVED